MKRVEKLGLAIMLIGILVTLGSIQGIIYYHTLGGAFRAYEEGSMLNPDFLKMLAILGGIGFFLGIATFFSDSSKSTFGESTIGSENLSENILVEKKLEEQEEKIDELKKSLKEKNEKIEGMAQRINELKDVDYEKEISQLKKDASKKDQRIEKMGERLRELRNPEW